jgi:membrane-associated phospholipid phosphatase
MKASILIVFLTTVHLVFAAGIDTIPANPDTSYGKAGHINRKVDAGKYLYKLSPKKLFVPLTFTAYGFLARGLEPLQDFDASLNTTLKGGNGSHTSIDNYIQYAPGLAVYALNVGGIKGRHNFWQRTIIYMLSNTLVGLTVESTKRLVKTERPDGSADNSFPSGHTAVAFAGAEFLYREYRDVSPWYGVAGYTVAGTTGLLRMYNNKHWFSDVICGAGLGILATRLSYWLGPKIFKRAFLDSHPVAVASW